MFELLGLVFGGLSRLGQHWLELQDKKQERLHELNMFDRQVQYAGMKIQAESELRQMEVSAMESAADLDALAAAIQAQQKEAAAAGGWVASFSAVIRPGVTSWLLVLYSAAKAAQLYVALQAGVSVAVAVDAAYTQYDGMLLNSVISFWFADRSLRKLGR